MDGEGLLGGMRMVNMQGKSDRGSLVGGGGSRTDDLRMLLQAELHNAIFN